MNSACVKAKLLNSAGAEIGYQHWWSDNLRSNFSYGVNRQYGFSAAYIGVAQMGAANKELQTAHANLLWNPVSFVTIGIEWMWGQRTIAAVTTPAAVPSNQMQAIIGKFDVAF
jgi:hypothetical protein